MSSRTVFRIAVPLLATMVAIVATSVPAVAATGWSVVASPNAGAGSNVLQGVSCASATSCVAVGHSTSSGGNWHTLVESWSGTKWSVVHSPNGGGVNGMDTLTGVSCASATSCKAVGNIGSQQQLIESWNGIAWSIDRSPKAASGYVLSSVSCASTTSCKAVGSSNQGTAAIESWNGKQWSLGTSPYVATDDLLDGVSCTSPTSCKAVGYYLHQGSPLTTDQTLIESWNGRKWSIDTSPDGGGTSALNLLSAVSCSSATSCKAVGEYQFGPSLGQALVESWNGRKWSIEAGPIGASPANALYGTSCVSATSCTAVGSFDNSSGGNAQTLVASWNGTKWKAVKSPNPSVGYDTLAGVSCLATSCQAVGAATNATNFDRTLVEAGP